MQGLGLTSLKRAGKTNLSTFLLICVCVFWGANIFAAPSRPAAVLKEFKKPEPEKIVKPQEVDFRVGEVIWVDGKVVCVNVKQNVGQNAGWKSQYYVCDARIELVATLIELGVFHRTCAMFLIEEGAVQKGDLVFVKQIPPEDDLIENVDVVVEK